MAGVKGRSGRKPITANSKEGKKRLNILLPFAISVIEKAVKKGNKEVSKWAIEMQLGKPRQQTTLTGEDTPTIRIEFIPFKPKDDAET